MTIACLGWGSLLWKSGALLLASTWQDDGPRLPVEFARVGDGGELATALCPGAALQSTWWALLATDDLATAREQLRIREAIDREHPEWVGSSDRAADDAASRAIEAWRRERGLQAVVWTALPPRIDGCNGRCPGPGEAVAYLAGLAGERRAHAEDYVRRVPPSLATVNRQAIATALGWRPYEDGADDTREAVAPAAVQVCMPCGSTSRMQAP
ncbi:hypothetical protein [uncultured Xylophilus sp.]|uniref:hypothetical protein n=1 Tax=uncultured Xylophilus sp. TaxID=296832 RepID=UPI0025F624AC|nr:hypothetical protein [uncultured Xylophilus sp.]